MYKLKDFDQQSVILQIERLCEIAQQLGYRIRYDYFGGSGGGPCEFSGKRWLFIDLALNSIERLELLREAIVDEPAVEMLDLAASERDWLIGGQSKRRAA